jgi:DNA-directed RNA polymerase specialized sigma24 family protein
MATNNNSSFVFYESFLKSIQNVERFRSKEEAFDFAMSIIEYGCYGLPPEDTNPAWLYGFEQVRASIDAAQDRRQKQIAQGKMGGRPRKSANIDEILTMRAQGMSIRTIAEQLNISDKTVRRRLQEHENGGDFISE